MPNTKSAIKRVKTEHKRYLMNRQNRSKVCTFMKKFNSCLSAYDIGGAKKYWLVLQSTIDSLAVQGYMHTNKAARLVSKANSKLKAVCLSQ